MKLYVRLTKQQVIKATSLSVVTALALGIVSPLVAAATPRRLTNQDKSVTNIEVKQALQNTTGVLDASDQTKATADSTDALKTASAGATVQVPKEAKKGVSIAANDGSSSLNVSLPNAAIAQTAQTIANGIVSYPSTTQSFANAVQANEDGSVRMLTVIDNPNAPVQYDYKVTVPSGGSIKLSSDGGALVLAQDGKPVAVVDRPWAKDANGKSIQTWFVTNGQTLTQYVKHNVAGVVYPVTADPLFVPVAVLVAVFATAVKACGLGYLASSAWQIFWNGWVWKEVQRSGRQGCVEAVVGRFIPWSWLKSVIKR